MNLEVVTSLRDRLDEALPIYIEVHVGMEPVSGQFGIVLFRKSISYEVILTQLSECELVLKTIHLLYGQEGR